MSARRGAIAALVAIALASSFAQFGAISALHDVARHFGHHASTATLRGALGLSGSTIGLGLAALRAASLLALPLTALADRWGRTPVLRVTIVAGLAVTVVTAASPSYWVFVALFALARPMLSASSALVSVLTVELSEVHRRVPRLVYVAAGAGVGAGISALLHGVVRGPDSFRWLFALAVVPLVLLAPARAAVPEPAPRAHRDDLPRLGAVPRGQRATLATVCALTAVAAVVTGPANGFAFVYGEG
ncbi:MAG TPA: MFS transporter, partial [Acidimicrobiales bacterium]|nr:MFS transporter [Acidimicrobiales bacterium]